MKNLIKQYATNKLSKQTQKEILTNGLTTLPPILKRYNIFLLVNPKNTPILSSNSKKATYKELEKYWWGPYEVRNDKNCIIEEFIPY